MKNVDTSIPEGREYAHANRAHQQITNTQDALRLAREDAMSAWKDAADDLARDSLAGAIELIDGAASSLRRAAGDSARCRLHASERYRVKLDTKLEAGAQEFERVRRWLLEDKRPYED